MAENRIEQSLPWSECVMGCAEPQEENVIILKCLHSLCSDACAAKMKAELGDGVPLKCKRCMLPVAPEDLKRKTALKDFFVKKPTTRDILERLKCSFCIFNPPAISYCSECPDYLCEQCSKTHASTRMTFQHKPSFDLDERKLIELELHKQGLRECKTHKEETSHFCITCQEKLCQKCIDAETGSHDKNHKVVSMSDEAVKMKMSIQAASAFAEKTEEAIQCLKEKKEFLQNEDWPAFQQQIEDEFLVLLKMLSERKNRLQDEGKKVFMTKLKSLELKTKRLAHSQQIANEFKDTCASVETAFDDTTATRFSILVSDFSETIVKLNQDLQTNFNSFVEKDLRFNFKGISFSEVAELIQNFGSISYCFGTAFYSQLTSIRKPFHPCSEIATENQRSLAYTRPDGFRINGGNNKCRGIAVKSTGRNVGRALGMPHIADQRAFPSLPPPAKIVHKTPPLKTYLSASQKNSQSANSVKANVLTTSTTVPVPSTSKAVFTSETTATTSSVQHQGAPPSSSSRNVETNQPKTTKVITARRDSADKFGKEGGDGDESEYAPELAESSEFDDEDNEESGNLIENMDEDTQDESLEATRQNDGTPDVNRQVDNSPQELSSRGKSSEPEIVVLTLSESEEINISADENAPKIRIRSQQEIASPGGSSVSAEGESPSHASHKTPSGIRTGNRSRKKKEYPDCVNLEQIRFSKRRDLTDPNLKSAPPAIICKRTRHRSSGAADIGLRPATKIPRLNQLEGKDDEQSSNKTIRVTNHHDSETGSDNEFESKDESYTPGRRHHLRSRRPPARNSEGSLSSRKTRKRSTRSSEYDPSVLPEATMESMEALPEWGDYPVQGVRDVMKTTNEDHNENFCCICLDGGGTIVCCDFCPKIFHLKCHMPILPKIPDDPMWHCSYDKSKEQINAELAKINDLPESENLPITDANPKQYLKACKFLMEIHKIPEVPTVKWKFPEMYYRKFGKVPYHLKFIRAKLCIPIENGLQPFQSVEEYLLALKQMFVQAFMIYQAIKRKGKNREEEKNRKRAAHNCFKSFRALVKDYYPEYDHLFENVSR